VCKAKAPTRGRFCCQVVRNVQNILQTNCSVASSLGPPFLSQMSLIYVDMLSVYKCGVHPHLAIIAVVLDMLRWSFGLRWCIPHNCSHQNSMPTVIHTIWDVLGRMYSELISATIASGGPHAAKTSSVKLMRSVKKVVLVGAS
jgi:exportin-1